MDWRGQSVVADYGNPHAEYQAVRAHGIGLVDRTWRDTLVIAGPDAISWLQGMVTSDVRELIREGSGQLTTAVNLVGRLIADARVLHVQDMLLLDLEPQLLQESLLPHLERHIITEEVQLLDRSAQTARLGLFGHTAAAFLQPLCDLVRPIGALELYEGTWGSIDGHEIIIQRIPLTGGPGYDISMATEDAPILWDKLMQAGTLTPVGFETIETLRIEAGVPRFGKELGEDRIPLEAGLNAAISFKKGCYLGQEIIARLDTRGTPARLLRTLVFEGGAAPQEGSPVEVDGQNVGELITGVWSPLFRSPIALAYVKRGHNDVGSRVQVSARDAVVQPLGHGLAMLPGNV